MVEETEPTGEHEDLELARLWMEGDELNMHLDPDVFDTPATWGVILAEVAHQIAAALAREDEAARQNLIGELRAAFTETLDARARGEE